jgi:hypothetical protein
MATTKAQLRERIRRLLEGGDSSTRGRWADRQIDAEVGAYIAKALRMQIFEGYKDGQRVPDGTALATYEGLPIERRDNGRCVITLPATPIMLPKGQGVYNVYPSGYPELEWIPLMAGTGFSLRGNKMLSPLGPKTYGFSGRSITINSDIVGEGVIEVDVVLCVSNISSLGENDILPIPQDMEADVVPAVAQLLNGTPLTERADDKQYSPAKADAR